MLSGFLITGIRLRARDDAPSVGAALRRFYTRRALRIFPLYYLVPLAGVALGVGTSFRADLPWHALYLTNWRIALSGHWLDHEVDPLWSLAIEEFYLVWPMLVLLVPRAALRPLLVGTVCAGVLSRAVLAVAGFHARAPVSVLQPTTSNLDLLAWGGLLAWARWALPGAGAARRRWADRALVAGVGLFTLNLACQWIGRGQKLVLVNEAVAAGLLSVWLVERAATGFPARSVLGRLFLARPMRYLGTISYGIYLLHSFVIWAFYHWTPWDFGESASPARAFAFLVAVLAITVALASLSWLTFEGPLNRLKDRLGTGTRPPSRADAITAA